MRIRVVVMALLAMLVSGCAPVTEEHIVTQLPITQYVMHMTDGQTTLVSAGHCEDKEVPDNGHGDWANPRTPVMLVTCYSSWEEIIWRGGAYADEYREAIGFTGIVGRYYVYAWGIAP